jgi:hypothetical protein
MHTHCAAIGNEGQREGKTGRKKIPLVDDSNTILTMEMLLGGAPVRRWE